MFRSLIFVPGNSMRFVEKAKTLAADIICFDLEDSVPYNEKDAARRIIAETLLARRQEYSGIVYVRTNSPESGLIPDDLKAVLQEGIDGIVVPKVNDVSEMLEIKKHIVMLEKERKTDKIALMPSIETARGVVNAYLIASAEERIKALVFGVFDFLYDMRLDYDEHDPLGYSYVRAKIPVDARAAGVHAIDAIWQKIDDIDGLIRDATMARRLGYSGKSIIHPSQIEPVHKVFRPSKNEVEWAKKVVQALGQAMKKGTGRGAIRLEGKMIDVVHYKQAKAILDAADT
ncbi:MAG: citE [Nitrososphaera sp.]|jgi:citrate lyase subunit beta / citryl-CoA lyase|nr:citE [Nitrososphaera sp.]MCY1156376.1 citE [Nitrososphaera sp.]MDW0141015.1 CoA ester lyase [Nitrososphaeraceae archaeon]